MKIVLASQGFTTREIAEETAKLAGKPLSGLNVAIINEAYTGLRPGEDYHWLIHELSLIAEYTDGIIGFVSLNSYSPEEVKARLEFADVIYIVGGKQVVLPKLFKETGFGGLLKEVAERKVIFGTSAGANVLGRQIDNEKYWENQYGSSEKYLKYPNLELVDFNILPHFEREDHPNRNSNILDPIIGSNPFPLYGLTDTQAAYSDNGNVYFVGGEPVKFGIQSA